MPEPEDPPAWLAERVEGLLDVLALKGEHAPDGRWPMPDWILKLLLSECRYQQRRWREFHAV